MPFLRTMVAHEKPMRKFSGVPRAHRAVKVMVPIWTSSRECHLKFWPSKLRLCRKEERWSG